MLLPLIIPAVLWTVTVARSIRGQLVPSDILPEMVVLPSTKVSLDGGAQTAFVTSDGSFSFDDVDDGLHLIEVLSRDYFYPKVRISVANDDVVASFHADGTNWNAPGPAIKYPLLIPAKAVFDPFMPRPKMSVMGLIMGNPMLLMMGATFAMFFFLPKMLENMDPEEMKKIQESRGALQPKLEMPDVSESLANWFAPAAPTKSGGSGPSKSKK